MVNAQVDEPERNETEIDLSMLGENSWNRLRPGWALTVNDQCLYEFVFQFEHDETLPSGRRNFEDECAFEDSSTRQPFVADDGIPFLEPRKFWEQFPDYVWATIGFNHLSIDWNACGHRPRGYSLSHYDFSFYRVTPEFRANTLTCDLQSDAQIIVPGEKVCSFQQDTTNGMGFFILPAAIVNRNPTVNMPTTFSRPELGNGPVPHVGLRSWDQQAIPATPNTWTETDIFMSSYAGDLVMWQAQVPYREISGDSNNFKSNAYRYHETTVGTLPDSYGFHYNAEQGIVRLHMVGQAGLCRADFEAAQVAAGGPPIFPNWDDYFAALNGSGSANLGEGEAPNGSGASMRSNGQLFLMLLIALVL